MSAIPQSYEEQRTYYKAEEDVINGSPDEGAEIEEFAIDSVQCSLEEIPFPWIFTVEELQELCTANF